MVYSDLWRDLSVSVRTKLASTDSRFCLICYKEVLLFLYRLTPPQQQRIESVLAAYFSDPANGSMADHGPNPCHGR
jgi:hypothetical protein